MMRRRNTLAFLGLALAVGLGAVETEAQRTQRPGARNQDRAQLERRVRARFGEMVQQRLGLSEEDAARLNEVVQSFQEDRRNLMRQEQALRRRMEAFLLEESDSEQEAESLLARMHELRLQEADLSQREMAGLMEVLGPVGVLRFNAMREEMGNRIRQLRGGGPGAGRPGGVGPPGGMGRGGA